MGIADRDYMKNRHDADRPVSSGIGERFVSVFLPKFLRYFIVLAAAVIVCTIVYLFISGG